MSTVSLPPAIEYPESDGLPMAENTVQYRCIVTVVGGLEILFQNDPLVFVAGDLFWYPVEFYSDIRIAPDVLVVFGRPKGDRRSYLQWLEENIPPQVVFEIVSPSNRAAEMIQKLRFYEQYGVEEYYVFDPDRGRLSGWRRVGEQLVEIESMEGWVSPRLQIRFGLDGTELVLIGPDGRKFVGFVEKDRQLVEAERQRDAAERQREQERRERAEAERQRAEAERQRAEAERQREQERIEKERLLDLLRQHGIEPPK